MSHDWNLLLFVGCGMSLPLPDIHVRVRQETHDRLVTLAQVGGKETAVYAAEILEEVVAGRFHVLMLALARSNAGGLSGQAREFGGAA